MTTQEFITKNFGVPSDKDRKCSSVYADELGNIYSYGKHYPLLFKVGRLTFVNKTGYSNTTAKHINWAQAAVNYNAVDVWVRGCNQYTWNNPGPKTIPKMLDEQRWFNDEVPQHFIDDMMQVIHDDLTAEFADITERINSKKRKDTKIYKMLTDERDDCLERLKLVSKAVA